MTDRTPPEGWFHTGTLDPRTEVEHSDEVDGDGVPLWERPVQNSEHEEFDVEIDEVFTVEPVAPVRHLRLVEESPEGTDPYGPDTIEEARGDK